MTFGTRHLNYTRRQRIRREHVKVTIHESNLSPSPEFSARIDLSKYPLPHDAPVYLDAYRRMAWQRFSFGTVGDIRPPQDRLLRELGAGEGVMFRLKVVEPLSASSAQGRILAQADGIIPDHEGPRKSLLPLEPDPELRDEIWRLDLDQDTGPLVRVSPHLVRDRHALARSDEFVVLALPEILRRILEWSLEDGLPDDDEWDSVRGLWIRQACGLLSQTRPPDGLDDDEVERERWIDEAVTRFCRRHGIERRFGKWWQRIDTSK